MGNAYRNQCRTYFSITGNFDPDDVTRVLGLTPDEQWRIGDTRRNGSTYDFAKWSYGLCSDYDLLAENQMMATLRNLLSKKVELRHIKRNYDVTFTLVIVPQLYADNDEPDPCLAPNRQVIEFCYETETDIDIDLYVYDASITDDKSEAPPVTVHYTVTEEAYLDFNLYHSGRSATVLRQARRVRLLAPLIWSGIALAAYAGMLLSYGDAPILFPAGVIAASLLWYLLYPRFHRKALRKGFASYLAEGNGKENIGEASLELLNDHLRSKGPGDVMEVEYGKVGELVENKGCLYIYIGGMTAFIVPLHAFDGEAPYRKFRETLERKVREVKK